MTLLAISSIRKIFLLFYLGWFPLDTFQFTTYFLKYGIQNWTNIPGLDWEMNADFLILKYMAVDKVCNCICFFFFTVYHTLVHLQFLIHQDPHISITCIAAHHVPPSNANALIFSWRIFFVLANIYFVLLTLST